MRSSSYQQKEGELLGREEFTNANNTCGAQSSKQFLRSLRTLLLRIRMAGQLRQDFEVEKHFVELKDLCRKVCAELRTTTAIFEELWAVVRQRRGDAGSSHQHSSKKGPVCSLAQDAETVSRSEEILRRAAAASNRHGFDTSTRDNCASEGQSSAPSPRSSHGDGTDKDEQSSACCSSPRQGLELKTDRSTPPQDVVAPPSGAGRVTFDNPADAIPLLALAETLGVGNAVDACLDFIATEKEAVIAAAKKRFSSREIFDDATSPSPSSSPVDWALAVQRLAAWPRRNRGGAHLQPTLLPSPRGENEAKEPWPPSPSLPRGFKCSRQFCGLRRVSDDKRGSAAVVERSTQCSDGETEDDGGKVHNHRTAMHRRKRVSRRNLRCALESSPRLRSLSPQASTTKSPSSSPKPPPPPPWPRVACDEPAVNCFDDGIRDGRVGSWRERYPGDRPNNSEPCATADSRCCQQPVHRGAAAPPFLGGCSVRGYKKGDVRTNSGESDDGDDQQVSIEEDGRDDDQSELSEGDTPRVSQNHEPEGGEGSDGGDTGERCGCYVSGELDSSCCRNDEDSTRAFRAPEATTTRKKFPSGAVARIPDDAAQPATWRKASVRVVKEIPARPSKRWPSVSFESDPSSDRQNASEGRTSQRRRHSHSMSCYDDEDDSGGDGKGGVETVRPGSREYNIKSNSGATDVPAMPEDGEEADGDDDEQDDASSCALARKRALLRVRLARQRHELATAVVDANERGLRAERRRRREEKLTALLATSRRGEDVGVCSGGFSGNRIARGGQWVRDESSNKESETGTSKRGVGTASAPSVGLRAQYPDGGGGDRGSRKVATARLGGRGRVEEKKDDDDDDAVPRKPLRVVPVESSTPARGRRSRCWRTSQEWREKGDAERSLGGNCRANSNLSQSICRVVVWIDALYAFEDQRESFHDKMLGGGGEPCSTGDALYLVLEDRFLQHRTATRPRHRGTWDTGRASRANEGQACRAGGQDEGVDAWIFRETVALRVATAEGRGRGDKQGRQAILPGDDDDHDPLLRVCPARSPAVSSSSPPQRRAPVLQETDAVVSAEGVAAPDEVIGWATIPLDRCLATADRDGGRKCTFSRPIRVSVVNLEGLAIGWIALGVCGSR